MSTIQQPSPTNQTPTEEDNPMVRTATTEVCIGDHWLQYYDDGIMEIVGQENYHSGNERGPEYVRLTPAELAALKAHLLMALFIFCSIVIPLISQAQDCISACS